MHLIDFIIRIYHDARSSECLICVGLDQIETFEMETNTQQQVKCVLWLWLPEFENVNGAV